MAAAVAHYHEDSGRLQLEDTGFLLRTVRRHYGSLAQGGDLRHDEAVQQTVYCRGVGVVDASLATRRFLPLYIYYINEDH